MKICFNGWFSGFFDKTNPGTHVGFFLEKSVYFSQQFKLEDFLLNDNVYKHDHQFHTQKISLGKEKNS